jgi:Transposase DDE domain group 1
MAKDTPSKVKLHSDHALLALIGHKCQQANILAPLHQELKIDQKTVKHSPTAKLQDCLLAIMQGAEAVYQINTLLKSDPAVCLAFGREGCADQSSIQETLSACNFTNVAQLQTALKQIFQQHSQTYRHDYQQAPLILDIDLTGLPCGRHLEGAEKGYFAGCKPGTAGRQLYRVSASQYDELVYQQVCSGNVGSAQLAVFKQVLQAAWDKLKLSAKAKSQVLIRLDSGFGTTEIINYLWTEGYQFVVKLFATSRARKLGRLVAGEEWQPDQCHTGRAGTVLPQAHPYYGGEPKLHQIGVRCPLSEKSLAARQTKAEVKAARTGKVQSVDQYEYSVLVISTVQLAQVTELEASQLIEQLHFYDSRATIESAAIRGDKQGLKLVKRRKQSLAGQEMLILLAQLAHNLIVWARGWLSELEPKLASYGIKPWVRDLLTMKGKLTFKANQLVKVRLSGLHQLARRFFEPLALFFNQLGVRLFLDET